MVQVCPSDAWLGRAVVDVGLMPMSSDVGFAVKALVATDVSDPQVALRRSHLAFTEVINTRDAVMNF